MVDMVSKQVQIEALTTLYERGDPSTLMSLYGPAANFESWLPGPVVQTGDREQIGASLRRAACGHQRALVEWVGLSPLVTVNGHRHRHFLQGDVEVHGHLVFPEKTPPAPDLHPTVPSILSDATDREVFAHNGTTQCGLERAQLADGRRVVAKWTSATNDFFVRNSADAGRELLLWRDGAVVDLDSELVWPVHGGEFDGDGGWCIVMDDLTDHLATNSAVLSVDDHERVMRAMLPLYERHADQPRPSHVMSMADRLRLLSPATTLNERDSDDMGPRMFGFGYERLLDMLPRELGEAVAGVHADPDAFEQALVGEGATLLHGDLNRNNLAFRPGRVDLFDWGMATWGPPDVDVGWFIGMAPLRGGLVGCEEDLVERWRRIRADKFSEASFDKAVIASLCTVGIGLGFWRGILGDSTAAASLDWWIPRFAKALETWSPS